MRSSDRVAADLDLEAWAAIDRGDFKAAEEKYRKALHLRVETLGSRHPDVALALSNLGWVLQGQMRFAEAETSHRQALDIRQSAFGEEHPAVARSLTSLGACLIGQHRYVEAEEVLIEAVGIYDNLPSPPHPSCLVTLHQLVRLYEAWSKPELVEQYRGQLYLGASSSDYSS